jgi:hypothetical protein
MIQIELKCHKHRVILCERPTSVQQHKKRSRYTLSFALDTTTTTTTTHHTHLSTRATMNGTAYATPNPRKHPRHSEQSPSSGSDFDEDDREFPVLFGKAFGSSCATVSDTLNR